MMRHPSKPRKIRQNLKNKPFIILLRALGMVMGNLKGDRPHNPLAGLSNILSSKTLFSDDLACR